MTGALYDDRHEHDVTANVGQLWGVVESIGGANGWFSTTPAWRVRGWIDRVVGGPGMRRGRPDPARLAAGDALDFWRVEQVRVPTASTPGLLRLRAEMRMPGTAWLEMGAAAAGASSRYTQRSLFAPSGPLGHAYWFTEWPLHVLVFAELARSIVRHAERQSA
jgi:hypothetical protein